MKFMLSLADEAFQWLVDEAKTRNVSVQDILRVIILPEWHFAHNGAVRELREKHE